MTKRILLSLLLLTAPTVMTAAETARDILDRTHQRLSTDQGYTTQFSTRLTETAKQATHLSEGSLEVLGERFHLTTCDSETWFDGKDLWSRHHESSETTLTTPTDEELAAINPIILLSLYKQGMTLALRQRDASSQGAPCYDILMTPETKCDIHDIALLIDRATYDPRQIIIRQGQGIELRITVNAITLSPTLTPQVFVYDEALHPDIELIDLR